MPSDPSTTTDEIARWWASLSETERTYWLCGVGTGSPSTAWAEYKRLEVCHGR